MKSVIRLPRIRTRHHRQAQPEGVERHGWSSRLIRRVARVLPLILLDCAVIVGSYLAILVVRFDAAVPPPYWHNFLRFVPGALAVHLIINMRMGLYRQMWKYASIQEARRVTAAGALSGLIISVADVLLAGDIRPLPLSVVILGAGLSLTGFGAVRFQSRLLAFKRTRVRPSTARVLVVGAGDAGASVLRDIARQANLGLHPVGMVDDDVRKIGLSLHGHRVLGKLSDLPSLVPRLDVDQVLFAIPSAPSSLVRYVAFMCEQTSVPLRVLPSVRETVRGSVTARDIRDLKIEDLLGRQQVETDLEAVAQLLRNRRVLVTGAGGSIGSEIARQACSFSPESLILLDHDETLLHEIVTDVQGIANVRGELADIRNRDRLLRLFKQARPEIVFHAAAHKHVPILEAHPEEAVATNVIGTANVVDASLAADVNRFVLISTDKAVKPASVMGASKRFAEKVAWCLDHDGCVFCAVRFGNVLGSRGSVVPTFLHQLVRGGPVTVTDPAMTRYFMSVQEAVQLVLQAAALSEGREIFTLDMGEPVNILDLAREVILLSGRIPGKDVEISVVGTRPGEKTFEELHDDNEEPLQSSHPAITVFRPSPVDGSAVRRELRVLEVLASEGRSEELSSVLKTVAVPSPPEREEIVL